MTFDNMRLSPSAIADLYRQSLVVLDEVQPTAPRKKREAAPPVAEKAEPPAPEVPQPKVPVPKPAIQYTGDFRKKISIVINDLVNVAMPPADLEMLQKLMAACKLTAGDFAIINTAVNQPAAQQLWQLMPAQVVLLFGVEYDQVGIPFMRPHFQVQYWDSAHFMSAPPLSAFQGADTPELKALKRELWKGLQKIFLGK